jgi:hypothetical protein
LKEAAVCRSGRISVLFGQTCPVLQASPVLMIVGVEQFGPLPHSMRESTMRNNTGTNAEITETDPTEITVTKVNWTYTALGYVFVLAMGAMAVWVTPSPDAKSAQKLAANAAASFTPFSGGTRRVMLGQPVEGQALDSEGEGSNPQATSQYHAQAIRPDQMPGSHPAPMAVAAYD